jgi:hypothetical protein
MRRSSCLYAEGRVVDGSLIAPDNPELHVILSAWLVRWPGGLPIHKIAPTIRSPPLKYRTRGCDVMVRPEWTFCSCCSSLAACDREVPAGQKSVPSSWHGVPLLLYSRGFTFSTGDVAVGTGQAFRADDAE